MVIRQMRPEDASAWFDFFDNRAFADHPDWQGCYCTGPFSPRLKGYGAQSKRRRDYAAWLVANGIMTGYLALHHGKVVGWCNVGDKRAFSRPNVVQTSEENVISITCFVIQKEYRGKGLAERLLARVIADARASKKNIIEAYPRRRSKSEFGNFNGPYSMYEKHGFVLEQVRDVEVVRLYL
jgi:GNAT superfamily N-acetyltransferase